MSGFIHSAGDWQPPDPNDPHDKREHTVCWNCGVASGHHEACAYAARPQRTLWQRLVHHLRCAWRGVYDA